MVLSDVFVADTPPSILVGNICHNAKIADSPEMFPAAAEL